MPNNNAGTSGQVLVSQGAGTPPQWQTLNLSTTCNSVATNMLQKWTGTELCNSIVYDDGTHVGIGMTIPSRAILVTEGSIEGTSAIFGNDTAGLRAGVSMLSVRGTFGSFMWPPPPPTRRCGMGFNSYYNIDIDFLGTYYLYLKSLAGGYGGAFIFDCGNGNLDYVVSDTSVTAPNVIYTMNRVLSVSRTGDLVFTGALRPGNNAGTSGQVLVSQGAGAPPQWQNLLTTCNSAATNRLQKWTGTELCNSIVYDDGTNVGIGTTNPTYKLHIIGRIKTTGINETSDIRLKTNITAMGLDALDKIERLRPVYYYWKEKIIKEENYSADKQVGFIAQEVKEIIPEIVLKDNEGYYSIEYTRLTPYLVKAVQELSAEIKSLKNEVKELKLTNDKLKAELRGQDSQLSEK